MSSTGRTGVGDAIRDRVALARDAVQELNVVASQRLFDHNRISRMSPLRHHKPVCPVPRGGVLLTRRADVLAVLEDDATFTATYHDKLLPGTFVLGVEGAEHAAQRDLLTTVLADTHHHAELDEQVKRTARATVEAGRFAGHLDVGAQLVHPVLAQVIENFLGLPPPDRESLWFWAHDIFADIFLNPTNLPAVRARGQVASARLLAHVRAVVAAGPRPGTVLAQLVAARANPRNAWLAEADVLEYTVIGLAIGWLWHGARAALTAVDELLDNAAAMALARAAASTGDHPGLARVLWEVLRFRPVQPFLLRQALTDTVVGAGTDHETPIAQGTVLLAGTHSAMWDERDVPSPRRFDATRADDQYVIFGRGVHRCLGEEINRIQLPAMLAPLLAVPDLRRGSRLQWDGARPDELRVGFGR